MKNRAIVRALVVAAVAIFITLLSGVTLAQDMPPLPGELVIGDLQTPRGISFDADGNLLVTVTGNGGEMQVELPAIDDPAAMMTVNMGLSGAVLSIGADGVPAPVVGGYPSYATPGETVGLYRAYRQGDSLWLVVSSAGPGAYWGSSVVELDAAGMTRRVISLYPYEAANNPDGNEIDSNVADIAWTADGTMLIADAGANALLSWTEADGLQTVVAWPSNDVPTSVEVAENGDIYVGFLGAGVAPGAGKVERWSNGALAETFGGMTGVTDILLDGDTLYAVELFLFGEQGPGPGDVLMVSADGNTVVAGGLITPFALAKGPDGALYVSYGTIAFAPGMTGGVVKLADM
ncbi:MAG: ScyD/ScyE family protein [Anaerolineae bacterium]|nr:ScyD/ScyE family protein [Anaerolineae bacterium]NUQ04508.1 ScyD/ScyE family protein [Anaerolineae bacterium]